MKIFIKVVATLVIFSGGVLIGHYLFPKKAIEIKDSASEICNIPKKDDGAIVFDTENQRIRTGMKLNLLQDYINFVFLPKEEVSDPKQYTDMMLSKVSAIKDEELSNKFYATGTENEGEREKNILDFINAVTESVKKELNK
ncbi:MAG: hypothetical protein Q7T51_03795 [Candidatus Moranbacteria bacterium]|nr:hypothetical protein [Candidatus Moranbacteria bacterium]